MLMFMVLNVVILKLVYITSLSILKKTQSADFDNFF